SRQAKTHNRADTDGVEVGKQALGLERQRFGSVARFKKPPCGAVPVAGTDGTPTRDDPRVQARFDEHGACECRPAGSCACAAPSPPLPTAAVSVESGPRRRSPPPAR